MRPGPSGRCPNQGWSVKFKLSSHVVSATPSRTPAGSGIAFPLRGHDGTHTHAAVQARHGVPGPTYTRSIIQLYSVGGKQKEILLPQTAGGRSGRRVQWKAAQTRKHARSSSLCVSKSPPPSRPPKIPNKLNQSVSREPCGDARDRESSFVCFSRRTNERTNGRHVGEQRARWGRLPTLDVSPGVSLVVSGGFTIPSRCACEYGNAPSIQGFPCRSRRIRADHGDLCFLGSSE